MSYLKIAQLGNPVLRKKAEPVPIKQVKSKRIKQLINDMVETMVDAGGVGLAAPQVYQPLKIIVVGTDEGLDRERSGNTSMPIKVFINPKITKYSEKTEEDWEGCLSFNSIRARVPRSQEIEVEAFNPEGKQLKIKATGFYARVIQHEVDHLNGIVYLDRLENNSSIVTIEEFSKIMAKRKGE